VIPYVAVAAGSSIYYYFNNKQYLKFSIPNV